MSKRKTIIGASSSQARTRFNEDVGSTRAAAFRVLALGEVIFALAVIGCLGGGKERFVQEVVDRGELGEREVSMIIGTIVVLMIAVLLLWDGVRRGHRPSSRTRSAPGVVALLALTLALDVGSVVESVSQSDAFVLTARQQRAFSVLLETPTFAGPVLGFAGVPSPEYIAFRILRSSPYARPVFLMLVTHARLPGRLYALVALRHLDRLVYDRFAGVYAGSNEEVMTFNGCIVSHTTAGQIVRAEHALDVRKGESGAEAMERPTQPRAVGDRHRTWRLLRDVLRADAAACGSGVSTRGSDLQPYADGV
jgi:hypothetical protein